MRTLTKHAPLTYAGELNGQKFVIIDDGVNKRLASASYNYVFSRENGQFARWGKTAEDDPDYSPFGPELLDIEISSASEEDLKDAVLDNRILITKGGCSGKAFCRSFCYKKNLASKTAHMSLDTFKQILDKMAILVRVYCKNEFTQKEECYTFPANELVNTDGGNILACHLYKGMQYKDDKIVKVDKITNVCQIAFGLCSTDSHPELWQILEETTNRDITPNLTINGEGLTPELAEKLSKWCGAIAVSVNQSNTETAYNAVKMLSQDYGMRQINYHCVISEETFSFAQKLVNDIKSDPRLSKLGACVFLSFKDRANTNAFTPVKQSTYNKLVEYCTAAGINYGFDSCAAPLYLKSIEGKPNAKELEQHAEPCESMLFSAYAAFNNIFYACSFTEKIGDWQEGLDILKFPTFMDIWNSEKVLAWREILLKNKRKCPVYQLGE